MSSVNEDDTPRDYAAAALKSGYDGSVQGVDGRRYAVDADASAYYDEIASALAATRNRIDAGDVDAADELVAIGSNALEGADGAAKWRYVLLELGVLN